MSPKIDFKRINAEALGCFDQLLREWLPGGTRAGAEYSCLNPTRSDNKKGSFSINVHKGIWQDFATGDKGGDPVSLYAYLFTAGDQGAAAKAIESRLGMAGESVNQPPTRSAKTEWLSIYPPASVPPAPVAHIKRGRPDVRWEYRDAHGGVLGYVCRFTTSEGGKEVLPIAWCRHARTGEQMWRWMAFPEPRWLYGLDRLADMPSATVLVVEGEKCADAAAAQLPELVVVSWPGGGKAVDKCDWSPLAGRRVIIWPDCDAQADKAGELLPEDKQPGVVAARKIADKIKSLGAKVWLLSIPRPGEKPGGWDVADAIAEGMTGQALADYIRAQSRSLPPQSAVSQPAVNEVIPGSDAWEVGLIRKDGGRLEDCRENVFLVLSRHPDWSGVIGYNEFTFRVEKLALPPYGGCLGEWSTEDDLATGLWLAQQCRLLVRSEGTIVSGVIMASQKNKFHPPQQWLTGLTPWDGVERLPYFLSDCLGVDNSEYLQMVGTFFMVGLVARIFRPGCSMQYMPVIEGGQGIGKSSFWRALGGEWYQETPFNLGDKDAYMLISGALLYEIAEMDSFNKAETTAMKAFITRQTDRYREPYGRRPVDRPRQCVFAGTTNHSEYLKDTTGNRRIWPIQAKVIDIDLLAGIRDQLFAEALSRFKAGARWHPTRDEEQRLFVVEQSSRQIVDPWLYPLQDWLEDVDRRLVAEFTSAEILCGAFKVELSKIDGNRGMATRLGNLMAEIGGWVRKRRSSGRRDWVYVRPVGTRIST